MLDNIKVSARKGQDRYLINGAVPIIFSIDNKTDKDISFLLPYPNPNNLLFETTSNCLQKKDSEIMLSEISLPVTIPSGESYEVTYFLNRYFSFPKECDADVSYNLFTVANDGSKPKSLSFEGKFHIELIHGTDEQLKVQYFHYSNNLKSEDDLERKEAAEALLFIDNPLCIDYVIPMLSIEDLEITGIRALSKFNTPKLKDEILKMLKHRESGVVSEAIYALKLMKVEIPRKEFIEMLSSTNDPIRYIGLEQLELNPITDDRKYIRPLLNDKNPAVAEKADKYYQKLNKLLSK